MREIPLEKFFVIPKSDNELEHDLKPGEMVIELVVPPPSQNLKSGVYEVRQKAAFDWPLAMASVALEMDGKTVKSARVVLGQVAPVPWISPEAAQALVGKTITPDTAMAAANAAVAGAKPLSHNKYKITLAKVAVKRAILNAPKRAADRRCRMMLNLDAERFDTTRRSVPGAALEGAIHRGRTRPHRASDQRWHLLVHAHPDLHRPRRRVGRTGKLLVEIPDVPWDGKVRMREAAGS